jgi:hypothetical protein
MPTQVLNISGSLNQVGRSQAVILPGTTGVMLKSHDDRVKMTTFIPWSAIKALSYETADAS